MIRRSADPRERFATVSRAWEGETVVCIGSGPSLSEDDAERAQSSTARLIAVNSSYLLAPKAHVLYFADFAWYEWQVKGIKTGRFSAPEVRERFAAFAGERVSIGLSRAPDSVALLQIGSADGLSLAPGFLATGANSGYQAINLAVLAGAKRILLLGYDMRFTGGRSHWHGDYPVVTAESCYRKLYAPRYRTMLPVLEQLGVEVINCAPDSLLDCFPKQALREVL